MSLVAIRALWVLPAVGPCDLCYVAMAAGIQVAAGMVRKAAAVRDSCRFIFASPESSHMLSL